MRNLSLQERLDVDNIMLEAAETQDPIQRWRLVHSMLQRLRPTLRDVKTNSGVNDRTGTMKRNKITSGKVARHKKESFVRFVVKRATELYKSDEDYARGLLRQGDIHRISKTPGENPCDYYRKAILAGSVEAQVQLALYYSQNNNPVLAACHAYKVDNSRAKLIYAKARETPQVRNVLLGKTLFKETINDTDSYSNRTADEQLLAYRYNMPSNAEKHPDYALYSMSNINTAAQ